MGACCSLYRMYNSITRGKNLSIAINKIYIFIYVILTALVMNLIIPCFQNPDEPQHFGAIMMYSLGKENKDLIEKELIKIMEKNNWRTQVGIGRQKTLPESFANLEFLTFYDFKTPLGNLVIYHYVLGKLLKIFNQADILYSYYFCRFISILFYFGSLVIIYYSFKKFSYLLDDSFLYGLFFILFLPQFSILSVSVNSDAPLIFLATLFFYSSLSLIMGHFSIGLILLMLLSAVASFFTDRSGIFLLFLACSVPIFFIKKTNVRKLALPLLIFFIVVALVIILIIHFFPGQVANNIAIIKANYGYVVHFFLQFFAFTGKANQILFLLLGDSFFLKFGWMAFGPPKAFYYFWRFLVLLSIFGIIFFLGKVILRQLKRKKSTFQVFSEFKIAVFFLLAIFIQAQAVWVGTNLFNTLGQGRYFYPLIIPIAFLFLFGLKSFFDAFHKKAGLIAVGAFIILELLFFNYTIWNYVIPVFHLTIKAPHPGI
jgi:hypothetical protein